MKPVNVLWIPAALLLLCSVCSAEPEASITTEYYDIRGNSDMELRNEMERKSPAGGHDQDAYTAWEVNWSYQTESTENNCSVSAVDVKVKVIYHLPRWTNPRNAYDPLTGKWNNFMRALQTHEDGHKNFALDAARAVEGAIREVTHVNNCEELKNEVDQAAQKTLVFYKQKEIDYDVQTQHGHTQRAVF